MVEDIVKQIAERLIENYVFLDVAEQAAKTLELQLQSGAYDNLVEDALADALTRDLQHVTKDKHLRVRRSRPDASVPKDGASRTPESTNYGFHKVEILEDNIGYLEFRRFDPPALAAETAAAAMKFLSNTKALVIDLRKNGGGDPEMVAFLCSYLFAERTHLNNIYHRKEDATFQFWTMPHVPGSRYINKLVFLLTSSYTFSAAEEFTYNLKVQGRATVVGERTRGGAHPGSWEQLSHDLEVFVPNCRSINPITNENWEGIGVAPDVETAADEAYQVALSALRQERSSGQ